MTSTSTHVIEKSPLVWFQNLEDILLR